MPAVRQTSFAQGELSPTMWGRTDRPEFAYGLATCRNFFINKHGAAISRPGTKLVREVKDSSKRVRLVPFNFSDTDSYVLEFGDGYVRFHTAGGTVLSGGVPYEVASAYTEADLPLLKIAQSGDVLFIAHEDHVPRTLSRLGATSWVFADLSFSVPAYWSYEFEGLHPLPVEDATHPAVGWVYAVTVLGRGKNGSVIESLPQVVTLKADINGVQQGLMPDKVVSYPDRPLELVVITAGLIPGPPSNVVGNIGYRIYKGRNGILGRIGEIDTWFPSASPPYKTFKDYGVEPDYSRPPPSGRNPFEVYDTSTPPVLLRTENPKTVGFFEDRLVFAGTKERPAHIFASASSSYLDFDQRVPSSADEALELELASRKKEEINTIAPLDRRLILFTGISPWGLNGAGGAPLAGDELPEAKPLGEIGASALDPLILGNVLLYARTKGSGIRALVFDTSLLSFRTADASVLSDHLFRGRSVVEWAFAEDPWGVVWAVRDDGALLSFSYDRDLGLAAWARHDTAGLVESLCAVPETSEDAVYLVVNRTINGSTKRYIERMTDRTEVDAARIVCLDCAATYDGAPASTISGLDHLEGEEVWAVADGAVVGPLTVSGGEIQLGAAASLVNVGLRYICDLGLLDVAEARTRKKLVTDAFWEVYASRGLKTGETFESLFPWAQHTVSGGYAPPVPETTLVQVAIRHTWNQAGRIVLRQEDPLPVSVYGSIREVQASG